MFRTLERAKSHFLYKLYVGMDQNLDSDGLYTGEVTRKYSDFYDGYASISGASGSTIARDFGVVSDYDKVILLTDDDCLIDEQTLLWIDDLTASKPDYVVKRIKKSQMGITRILISKIV